MPYTFNPFTGTLDYYASGSGTPGGSDGDLQFNNAGAFGGIAQTLLAIDRTNLRVGVLNATPSVPFHVSPSALVQYTAIDGTTAKFAEVVEVTSTDSASTVANRVIVGILVTNFPTNPSGTKAVSALVGNLSTPAGLATTLTNVSFRSLNAVATHNGTGVLRDVWGGNYNGTNASTGTVQNLTGVRSVMTQSNAGGNITTYKAFESVDLVNAGTISQAYSFYSGILTVGTNTNLPYAFYNADADAVNYFLGSTIPRITVAADATSITPDSRYCNITQQTNTQAAGTLTIVNDAGIVSPKPYNGQSWTLKIKSTNVQTFAWGSVYIGGSVPLPVNTTGGGKTDYYSFLYDTIASKMDYTGSSLGF